MGRTPCCSKEGLNRGAWTAMEDKILTSYMQVHGEGKWRNLPKRAGLKRCGKSCRLRWLNYLRPDIKRGNISRDEEELIIRLHNLLGNRWSLIAGRLPGRTDNEIKNYWNTTLHKKVQPSARSPTSPALSKDKPTSLVFPSPIQELPSSAPAAKAIRPQVVRVRATRCNVTNIFASNVNSDHHHNSLLDPNSQIGPINPCAEDSEVSRFLFEIEQNLQENCPSDFDFADFGCGDDGFQASNHDSGENGNCFRNYCSSHIPMEESMLENWATKGGGGGVEEMKDILDIDSLTLLFDNKQDLSMNNIDSPDTFGLF